MGSKYEPNIGENTEERLVQVNIGRITLAGNLTLPEGVAGLVLFAHESRSSRQSPRNRYVAEIHRGPRRFGAIAAATLGFALVYRLVRDPDQSEENSAASDSTDRDRR